ncbi:hypothetical protein DSO57_1022152 [Entomophthora muscae]|nr:hypothetical protein DSO57_1022152 [Entomophthora muscae]
MNYPTGVPLNLKTSITDAYLIKHDPTIKSENEQFSRIVQEIFIAMRTPVNRPYSDIDLSAKCFEIGVQALAKLVTTYDRDPKMTSPQYILISNQSSWVLGNASLSCPVNQLHQLNLKYTKSLRSSANLPSDLVSKSQMVVKMWGNITPISRMENVSFNFLDVLKLLGPNGASQVEKAIEHLNHKYPSSV